MNRSHEITASVETGGKADGAIVAFGGYLSWHKRNSGHVVPALARRELIPRADTIEWRYA